MLFLKRSGLWIGQSDGSGMEPRIIDTKGFNFRCPQDRSYVIFDPQDQEEYDRLDAVLGGTEIFETAIKKLKGEMPKGPIAESQIHPVGLTNLGEVIAIIVTIAINEK